MQRCLVHVLRNIRVDLTNKPGSEARREPLRPLRRLTKTSTADAAAAWLKDLNAWHVRHGGYLKEKPPTGRIPYM